MNGACRLFLSLLLAGACSEPRTAPGSGGRDAAGRGTVRVVFTLPGDDIGSPESAALLERVKLAVAAAGIGDVVGSGFGMGRMELVVRLRGEGARAALGAIIGREYPSARYRVEQTAP